MDIFLAYWVLMSNFNLVGKRDDKMHNDIIVLRAHSDYPCTLSEDDIFEKMNGAADYVQTTGIMAINDIVDYLQETFYTLRIDVNVRTDPEDDNQVMVTIPNPKDARNKYITDKFVNLKHVLNDAMSNIDDSLSYYKVRTVAYDEYDLWICTDLLTDAGDFEVMPLDTFMDYLKYLEYNEKTKGKEVVLYFDKVYDYHY